ncbi:MAG: PD-(D/E)XK nuclease family protein, partial [Candidatus Thalassarchaeaceae archaeon]|nr:PD-(D/E)XK nuclease family protein [Candidatus Thalassarchaeaceae archaeon]
DEWLTSLTKHINWERLLEDAGALQRLLEGYTTLRRSQSILDHRPATSGSRWVEDLLGLLEDVNVPTVVEASDRVRLLTPEDALGTSADLILLTHLTSTQWNLSTERLPWMNEEERTRLNLNRPDSPLRHARHVLHHLLHASQQTILIDATGLDEDAQPAAPLSEWFAYRSGANSPDDVLRPSFMSDDSRWETASSNRTRGHHLSWRPSRIEIIRESDQSRVETFLSGRGQRNRRQQSGLELHASRSPDSPPLNPDSVSIPLDSHVMQDRLRRQPTDGDGSDSYLRAEHHDRFIAPGNLRIVPTKSGAGGLTKPRNADSWPVLGGIFDNKHLLATDPRPFSPSLTELPVFDSRHGQSEDTAFPRQIWSASRLKKWQDCPRQGWLERRLGAGQLEYLKEDLDARIRGNLIHGALGAVFEHALGIPEHTERPSKGAKQLHKLGKDPQELFVYILDYLAQHAPWLEREDATATLRRHDLIGLSRNEWLDWLASPKPILPTGRLGRMLLAELELYNTLPIAMEWSLDGIEIPHPDGRSIRMNGYIDRVDVFLPFEILKNSTGSSNQRHEMNKKFYEYRLEEWKLQKEEFETYKKLLQRFLDVEKKLTDQMLEEAHLTRKEFDEKSSVKYYERKSTVQGEISEILTDTGSIVVDGDLIIKISTSGGVKNIYFNKEIAEVIDILIDVGQSVNKGDVLIKSDHLLARLKDRAPHLPLDDLKILRLVIDELQGYIPKGQHHITLESGHTWIIRQYHPSEEHAGDHFPVTIYSPEMEGFLPGENLKESIDEFEAIERKYQKLVRDGFAPYFDPEYECAELEKLRPPVVFDPGPKPQEPIVDEKLPLTIAPLDWSTSSEWVPERLIVIRDIKSIDGPKKEKRGERHRKALYDELQLALYARAWEIAHPGDLVIGVGISEIGENTEHRLEVSLPYLKLLEDNGMGKVTNFTHSTHRLPSEGPSPSSDAFRAWMQERLSTAINVATAANEGRVIATPSEETCRWCDVKQACGLAPIVGGDRSWN